MGNQINIDGVLTLIQTVDFDGDTDITSINLDGTEVWVKAPTALQVASGLYTSFNSWIKGDASSTGSDPTAAPGNRSEYSNSAGYREVGTHYHYGDSGAGHYDKFSGYSISEDSPLDSSPNNTAVFIQYGNDPISPDITGLEVNDSSITKADGSSNNTCSVAVGYTDTALESIASLGATFEGGTYNAASHIHSMVLPGKWDVTLISSDQSASATIDSGDIFIWGGQPPEQDYYGADRMPDNWGSLSGGESLSDHVSLVFERQRWWYTQAILGIWVNKTSSSVSASWHGPCGDGDGHMIRLRHIGV